jgi:glutaryl-CoA dehydrogenase
MTATTQSTPEQNASKPIKGQTYTTDFFDLDEDWTEEQRAAIDQVRRFVDNEILPTINEDHNVEKLPDNIMAKIGQLGILEMLADGTLDPITYGLICREFERGSSALRSIVSVQGSLVIGCIRDNGSDEQKERWLKPLGSMEAVGCFGLTEPDFGSNPGGMVTRAEKTDKGYILNGAKCWITSGTLAHVAIIWAKLDGVVKAFLVPTDTPGFDSAAIKGKWSFRTSDTGQLFLADVEVPESALMPGAKSLGRAMATLNNARYGIVWGVAGAARGCFEECLDYLQNRVQFDNRPLTCHQLIQNKFAWMATEITSMELIAKRLGELKRDGRLKPHQVSLAKMNNCRKAIEIARTCRELMGANGIHSEYHIGRRLVDLETVLTYEGTEHIHSLILGQAITGIPAYS